MKKRISYLLLCFLLMIFGCAKSEENIVESNSSGQIYLVGETHGFKRIYDEEFKLWSNYYHNENFRHLFVEYPSYTGAYLNEWMQSDSDEILDSVYKDWIGTLSYNEDLKEFLKRIKENCPETIFHGTDVGHQYDSTGQRYLKELKDRQMQDSDEYKKTQEVIEQGIQYYKANDQTYRENKMVENFISEFNQLKDENIMGIYGVYHTNLNGIEQSSSLRCMANQLKDIYPTIQSVDLSELAKNSQPEKIEEMEIAGKKYETSYFGEEDLTGFKDFKKRRFWRIENAYDDFKRNAVNYDSLPYNNYPMSIEAGQVYLVEVTKTDDSIMKLYYRSDNLEWKGMKVTTGFLVE